MVESGDIDMRKILIIATTFVSLIVDPVFADDIDRAVDGALGGAAGGILLGPIGLVAGAITGATAGPAISHSWGLDRKSSGKKSRSKTTPPAGADESN